MGSFFVHHVVHEYEVLTKILGLCVIQIMLLLSMNVFVYLGDNWKEARKLNVSTQHILVPMHVNVELSKAMVFMDIRMPKYVYYLFHVFFGFSE
jgi:hypothetical protein